jgi:hypothetical protein
MFRDGGCVGTVSNRAEGVTLCKESVHFPPTQRVDASVVLRLAVRLEKR